MLSVMGFVAAVFTERKLSVTGVVAAVLQRENSLSRRVLLLFYRERTLCHGGYAAVTERAHGSSPNNNKMKDKEKYAQFVRFCANGVLAVAIQYGVYLLLVQWINPFAANTVGYAVSFCVNFIITSYWTFRSRPSWRKLAGFGGSHIVNYICQQAFLALFLWAGIAKEYAAIMAMGSAVPVNFMILRVIYKKKPDRPDRPDRPEGPEDPDRPEDPDEPDGPEGPDRPEDPDDPEAPEAPDYPEHPGPLEHPA